MAMFAIEGFDFYEPRSKKAKEQWSGKQFVRPKATDPYSFKWGDGVAVRGEFKGGRWTVNVEIPGQDPIEMLFIERPTFIVNR